MELFQPNNTIYIRQKKHTKRRNETIFARLFIFLKNYIKTILFHFEELLFFTTLHSVGHILYCVVLAMVNRIMNYLYSFYTKFVNVCKENSTDLMEEKFYVIFNITKDCHVK